MLNSFCWRIDIVLTKDDIHTLTDVVIANPMWMNLLLQFCATQGFIASDVIQVKERNYNKWHPTDQFLPLAIEVFICLHKQVDVFLHDCVNAIWSLKGLKGLPLYVLVTFFQ
jgi:hypothetical protein